MYSWRPGLISNRRFGNTWGHTGANSFADRTSRQGWGERGGEKRKGPSGGSAYGMPASTLYKIIHLPLDVCCEGNSGSSAINALLWEIDLPKTESSIKSLYMDFVVPKLFLHDIITSGE